MGSSFEAEVSEPEVARRVSALSKTPAPFGSTLLKLCPHLLLLHGSLAYGLERTACGRAPEWNTDGDEYWMVLHRGGRRDEVSAGEPA